VFFNIRQKGPDKSQNLRFGVCHNGGVLCPPSRRAQSFAARQHGAIYRNMLMLSNFSGNEKLTVATPIAKVALAAEHPDSVVEVRSAGHAAVTVRAGLTIFLGAVPWTNLTCFCYTIEI
jgi:hypothetical protein